jgi:hypothetical protein
MRPCTDASPDFIISQGQAMTEEDSDDARNGFHLPVLKGGDGGKTIIA